MIPLSRQFGLRQRRSISDEADEPLPLPREWEYKSLNPLMLFGFLFVTAAFTISTLKAANDDLNTTTTDFWANFLKCGLTLGILTMKWREEGMNASNTLFSSATEICLCAVPGALDQFKSLCEFLALMHMDGHALKVLKNLDVVSTGLLNYVILRRKFTAKQWFALLLLLFGCILSRVDPTSDLAFNIPLMGWLMAIITSLVSGSTRVFTEIIVKKRPTRNTHALNFWLAFFRTIFNGSVLFFRDYNDLKNKGLFAGYSSVTFLMILMHAAWMMIASCLLKHTNNVAKVHFTSAVDVFIALAFNLSKDRDVIAYSFCGFVLVIQAICAFFTDTSWLMI